MISDNKVSFIPKGQQQKKTIGSLSFCEMQRLYKDGLYIRGEMKRVYRKRTCIFMYFHHSVHISRVLCLLLEI
jgi:hypothetical protein